MCVPTLPKNFRPVTRNTLIFLFGPNKVHLDFNCKMMYKGKSTIQQVLAVRKFCTVSYFVEVSQFWQERQPPNAFESFIIIFHPYQGQVTLIYFTTSIFTKLFDTGLNSAVGNQYVYRSRGPEFDPCSVHTLVEIDHEIIFTVILLRRLIQEGFLSVTSESMCRKYWLTA